MSSVDETKRDHWLAQQQAAEARQHDGPAATSTTGGGGGTYDGMETRVAKLEDARIETVAILARIEQRLDSMDRHLATKADLADLHGEMKGLKGALEGKLGVWQFITVMGGSVALILAWPALSKLLGV